MKIHKTPLYFYIITTLLMFFNAIMLIFPKEILKGAKNGLLLWYNNVVPSLLPFMIFTAMLVKVGFPQRLGRVMAPLCKRLFNISGEGAFAMAIGVISGCPLGAKTACDLYNEGLLSRSEAERLTMFCNNTGPLFVVGAVGEGMFGNGRVGMMFLLIQYISAVILGIISGIFSPENKISQRYSAQGAECNLCDILSEAVLSGVNGITLVGGFIVLFSVICAIFESCRLLDFAAFLLPVDRECAKGLIAGILEVTNGMGRLTSADKINYPVICAVISWGGLSIHAQSASFISGAGLSVGKYLVGKLIQGIMAGFICFLIYSFI